MAAKSFGYLPMSAELYSRRPEGPMPAAPTGTPERQARQRKMVDLQSKRNKTKTQLGEVNARIAKLEKQNPEHPLLPELRGKRGTLQTKFASFDRAIKSQAAVNVKQAGGGLTDSPATRNTNAFDYRSTLGDKELFDPNIVEPGLLAGHRANEEQAINDAMADRQRAGLGAMDYAEEQALGTPGDPNSGLMNRAGRAISTGVGESQGIYDAAQNQIFGPAAPGQPAGPARVPQRPNPGLANGGIPVEQQLNRMVQDQAGFAATGQSTRPAGPELPPGYGMDQGATSQPGQGGPGGGLYQEGQGYFNQGAGEIASALQGMGGLYGTAANAVGTGLNEARGQYGAGQDTVSDWGRAVGGLYQGARGDLQNALAGELGQYEQGQQDVNNWEQGLDKYYGDAQGYLSGGLTNARGQLGQARGDIEGGLGRVRDQYGLAQGDVDLFGRQALGRIEEGRVNRRASSEADLLSRGLGASTIVGAMGQGIDRESDDQVLGVEESRAGLRTGLRERLAGAEQRGGESLSGISQYGAGLESDFSGRQSDLASRRGDQTGQIAGARLGLRGASGQAIGRAGEGMAGLGQAQAGEVGNVSRASLGLREGLAGTEMGAGRSLADIYSGLGQATGQAGRDIAGMRQGQGALTSSYAGLAGQLGGQQANLRQQGGLAQADRLQNQANLGRQFGLDQSQYMLQNRPNNPLQGIQPYVEGEEGSPWGQVAGVAGAALGSIIAPGIGTAIGYGLGNLAGGAAGGSGSSGGGGAGSSGLYARWLAAQQGAR